MTGHKGKSAWDMLGSPDDLKFRSCLTLFAEAASDGSDRALFKQALDQFYGGQASLERWSCCARLGKMVQLVSITRKSIL